MPAKTVFNPLYKAKEFCTVLSDMGDDESTDDFFGMAVLCTVAVLAETRFFSGQARYCHSGLVNLQASRHPGLLDMKKIQTSGLTIFATAETIYLPWQLKNSQAANTQNL